MKDLMLDELKGQIISVIQMAGTNILESQIQIIDRGIPHKPVGLPKGNFGIYSFQYENDFLKIGMVGQNSNARFVSQHYIPNSSQSNLAKSILMDSDFSSFNLTADTVGEWIKLNVRRIDFIIDASLGVFVLNPLGVFQYCDKEKDTTHLQ